MITIKKNVAVLGLGIMGGGMARQLLAAGHDVAVWNRDAGKAAPFAQAGARVAASPSEAASGAEIVIAMLADDQASRAVWTGTDGALASMSPGAIAIECSTLTVDWIKELGRIVAERGVRLLDAPVSGSKDQAHSGNLRFLVGGDATVLAEAQPILEAMAASIEHIGPTGSGALIKLINNFLCGVQVASMAEAIAMIEASGLDPERTTALLVDGAPGSPLLKTVAGRMTHKAYDPNFLVPLMAKDLSYAETAFAAAGIRLDTAAAARVRFDRAVAEGFAEKDIAAVVEPLRSRS